MKISGIKLKRMLEDNRLTQGVASVRLGIARQTLNSWCSRAELDQSIIDRVKTKLGIDLTDGDNNTATDAIIQPAKRAEARYLRQASGPDYLNTGETFTDLGDGTISMRIPVVPHRAYAGYMIGFEDPQYYEDLNTITIDVIKQHSGHYLAFEVSGDSMTTLEPDLFHKSILDGWTVVGRELPRHQWKFKLHTHTYSAWVLVHKTEGILVKQIIEHDIENGIITIHSLNPDKERYPDEKIRLDDLLQIFNIVQKIVTN